VRGSSPQSEHGIYVVLRETIAHMAHCDLYIRFERFTGRHELLAQDAALLAAADQALKEAYAPYSKFRVGAAARLSDGSLLKGSNQENASYPTGICAERVLLSAVSALHPKMIVHTLAITYEGDGLSSAYPLAPCGLCRQTIAEYEERYQHPIRLLLAGQTGEVLLFAAGSDLLPFKFSGTELPSLRP